MMTTQKTNVSGLTPVVSRILSNYRNATPGARANLARILMSGRLGGTGKMVILPVDQGFEHGPARSFATNPAGYDPHYLFQLALDAGLNALAVPRGIIECAGADYAGILPLILKANSANSLSSEKNQAITASPRDAARLGCSAVGYTVYPGSEKQYEMFEEVRAAIREAEEYGLAVVVWAYPRGGELSKDGETAIDVVAYSAHIAALLGAHIIKVKVPTGYMEQAAAKSAYEKGGVDVSTKDKRIAHVMQSAFDGRRLVVFSGGSTKDLDGLYDDVRAVRDGGGNGSIIGRNSFQRPRDEALAMLGRIIDIYQGAG